MNSHIMKDIDMSSDYESDWISINTKSPGSKFRNKADSLQLIWTGATGTLDGELQVKATNDINSGAVGRTFIIDTADNSDDSELIILYPYFKHIKLIYTSNNISGGTLNAVLSY